MPAATPIHANTDTLINDIQSRISNLETLLLRQPRTIDQLRMDRSSFVNQANSSAVTPDSSQSYPQKKRNYQMILMSEFGEALDFMKDAFTQPSISPVLNECRLYYHQFHKQLKIADEQSRREEEPPPAAILAVLPSRERCDQFVNLYFEYSKIRIGFSTFRPSCGVITCSGTQRTTTGWSGSTVLFLSWRPWWPLWPRWIGLVTGP